MDRYTSPVMADLWGDDARYERWRQVELAVLDARAYLSGSQAGVATAARTALKYAEAVEAPDSAAVAHVEATTAHDVVAFLLAWTASMPPEVAAQVHQGLTSSDVVDTANAVVLRDVSRLLDLKATSLLRLLAAHARAHARTLRLARTHGQPAGPDVWGHRVADFGFAIARTRDRLRASSEAVAVAKISGPVGAYTGVSKAVELRVAERLRLRPPASATQVLFRDTLAAWGSDCASIAAVCEAIVTEVRLGAVFEVGELQERACEGRVGSSAIPAKHNPISSEKVTGLARVLRGAVGPLLEDVALWQHRDISQSSVERVELPLIAALTEHVLDTTFDIVEGLVVHDRRMLTNLTAAGLLAAGPAMLDYLTTEGVPRLVAMRAVEMALAATRTAPAGAASATAVRQNSAAVGWAAETFARQIRSATNISLPFNDPLAFAVAQVLDNPDLTELFDRLDQAAAT